MDEIKIKNYMEDCVSDMMKSAITSLEGCHCERCQLDIMAYVLNKLPPKYVVTHKGHLYTKISALQSQFDVDILTLITQASAIVGSAPRHDDDDE